MLWTVRLTYSISVDAPSKHAAHAKATAMLRASPEAFISKIEDARYAGTNRSLLKRLITGR